MGLVRGAVFHHCGVLENSPLALMGRFSSLMSRFPTLIGRSLSGFMGSSPSSRGPVINFDVAQLLTLKWPKRGPVINFAAYIYICI